MEIAFYAFPLKNRTDWKEQLYRFMEDLMFAVLAEQLLKALFHA